MDKETLDWLEDQRRFQNGTLDTWEFSFSTEEFYITVKGGENSGSEPSEFLDHISKYKIVTVSIYDRRKYIQKISESWGLKIPSVVGDEWGEGVIVDCNVRVFPHKGIYPIADIRFKEQSWAAKFKHLTSGNPAGMFSASAQLSLEELYEVIRYLLKLDNLMAFV